MDRAPRQATAAEGLVAAVAAISILYFGRAIFVPLALAILLSFVLHPAALLLRRLHFGRALSVLTVVFLAACLVLGLGAIATRQITGLAASLPRYEDTLSQKIKNLRGYGGLSSVFGRASGTLEHLGHELEQGQGKQDRQNGLVPDANKPVPVEIRQPEWALWERYRSLLASLSDPIASAGIVLVFLVFIMLQREDLRDRIIRLSGPGSVQQSTAAMDDAGDRLSRYFLTQTAVNSVFGCVIGVGLAFIGIPNAVLFGAVAAIMRFVPFIGSFIAAAMPLVLAAAIDPGWSPFFWTLALYVAGESIVGQVVEPLAYGHTTGLSPFAVIVSASFWTWLWGPVGLVMAVPLTVCIAVLASHVKRFEFLHILLSNAPALTEPQSFYQRMLAGNAGEAAYSARQYLKVNSLCQYYSEVAIPGLTLAHRDWESGILSRPRLLELQETVEELAGELDDYEDAAPEHRKDPGEPDSSPSGLAVLAPEDLPAAWNNGPVLAIGGRTPLDAAGAAILSQLLSKHGIPASVPPSGGAGSGLFKGADISATPLICISYFGASAAHAHIGAMVRRLRSKQAAAKVLLCCWDAPDDNESTIAYGVSACAKTPSRCYRLCSECCPA